MIEFDCNCSLCQESFNSMTEQKEYFLRKIIPGIYFSYLRDDINITLSIAQAIHESDWGKSELAKKANNLYGIKSHVDNKYKSYIKVTEEYINNKKVNVIAKFKKYDNINESISHHGYYLATRSLNGILLYKDVIKNKNNYNNAITALYLAGYATNSDYRGNLLLIVKNYKIYNFEKCLRGK
ncbi:MAG: glycoside hydrolase family 73 protein [Promethearchaeota archaeon]